MELCPLPDIKAETAAQCLMHRIVSRHGPPKALVSDLGAKYTSKLYRALCRILNIKQRTSSAYHPASDGQAESGLKTMTGILRRLLKDKPHQDWSKMLDFVSYAYNSSIHSTTLQSPYYILHARDPHSILDLALDLNPDPMGTPDDYISQTLERMRYSFLKVREATAHIRLQHREQYNKRAEQFQYKRGDRVLLSAVVADKDQYYKFVFKFKGPYRVIRVYDNFTVDVANETLKPQRVHMNRLTPLLETMLWRDEKAPEFRTRF
jgi:hypothetical protein